MRKIKLSIHIRAPREDVFRFLSEPANLSKWNSVMESADWTSSDAAGVGSTYSVLAKMPGGTKKGLFEITQWDPPQRYGYRSLEIAFPFKAIESTITLAPQDGGTELTFEAQFALAGLLSLVEGMFVGMAEKGDGANLATAKRLLEGAQHDVAEQRRDLDPLDANERQFLCEIVEVLVRRQDDRALDLGDRSDPQIVLPHAAPAFPAFVVEFGVRGDHVVGGDLGDG